MARVMLCAALLCGSQACAAVKQGLPQAVVPAPIGVNIHFTGRQDMQVAKIAEAGFRFVRMDFAWSAIETKKGEYDFKQYDELVDSLAERGIRPLFILDYGNEFYDDGLAPHTDVGRAAFARFVEAGAAHFKDRGVIWELWNEPNLATFWKPRPNPDDYVKLAEMVYRAAKKGDPNSFLVAPALAGWDFNYLEQVFQKGLLKHLDAVSVHPYGSGKPEDALRYYENVRALIARYAAGDRQIPVIDGEWGYASVKEFTVDMQARFIARKFLVNLMNRIALSIWYDWRNDGTDPNYNEHNFGTLYYDCSEKPAYKAVQVLTSELNGYRFAQRLDAGSDDDYLALFVNGEQTCLAAWTTGKPHKVTLPVDVEKFATVSLLGDRAEVEARDGKLEIEITDSVQYVRPVGPVGTSRRWMLEAGWAASASESMGNNGLELRIASSIESETPHYEFFVGKKRLTAKRLKLESEEGWSTAEYAAPYVSDGSVRGELKIVARLPQLREPLSRRVVFDNVAAPTIEVAPPSATQLMIAVNLPERAAVERFSGSLSVGNYEGIRLVNDTAPVTLGAADQRQMLKFTMTQLPAGIYSFSLRLTDEQGREIVRVPARRYSLAETFAGGVPGEEVAGYAAGVGGDAKVSGEAKLSYATSPQWGPGPVCVKLEYRLDPGWKYVQIVPKTPMAIPGKPTSVKIWIKGQKNNSPAVLRCRGSDGQTFQNLYGKLDMRQWQILTAELQGGGVTWWGASADGIVRYPLEWDSLLLVDKPSNDAITGEVYVGPIMLCYD